MMNVWLQYGGSESILYVKDFEYKIYTSGYDRITNAGDYETSMTRVIAPQQAIISLTENASNPARVEYSGGFVFYIYTGGVILPYSFYATLIVTVENNTCTISAQ